MLPLRLVLDTNILVSAALKPESLQRTALTLAMTKPGRLYVSQPILDEYAEVLARPELHIRHEDERLHARQADIHILGGVTGAHHTAGPEDFAVANQFELHAGLRIFVNLVVDADGRGKFLGAFIQFNPQDAPGMSAQAMIKCFAADAQRVGINGLILMRSSPVLGGGSQVEVIQPNGARSQGRCRRDNRRKKVRRHNTLSSQWNSLGAFFS